MDKMHQKCISAFEVCGVYDIDICGVHDIDICGVHDMVSFWDQSASAEKSWHLILGTSNGLHIRQVTFETFQKRIIGGCRTPMWCTGGFAVSQNLFRLFYVMKKDAAEKTSQI